VQATLEAAVASRLKVLFVTPECLAMTWVSQRLAPLHISLVCIDEAHYVSETSANCRPGCTRVPHLLAQVAPAAVRCATTCTAATARYPLVCATWVAGHSLVQLMHVGHCLPVLQ
jgi:superfamily II DNA helicase RecQ